MGWSGEKGEERRRKMTRKECEKIEGDKVENGDDDDEEEEW